MINIFALPNPWIVVSLNLSSQLLYHISKWKLLTGGNKVFNNFTEKTLFSLPSFQCLPFCLFLFLHSVTFYSYFFLSLSTTILFKNDSCCFFFEVLENSNSASCLYKQWLITELTRSWMQHIGIWQDTYKRQEVICLFLIQK